MVLKCGQFTINLQAIFRISITKSELVCRHDRTTTRTREFPGLEARTEKVCANAKADNIGIYSIPVINGNWTLAEELRDQV